MEKEAELEDPTATLDYELLKPARRKRFCMNICFIKKGLNIFCLVGLDIPDYITDDVRPREVQDIIKRLKEKHYLWYFDNFRKY